MSEKKKVTKKELLYIADLADLDIKEEECDEYLKNLEEILEFADIINNADTEKMNITIGVNDEVNVFRKDEVKEFENMEGLLENAPDKDQNMYRIPKVIN